MKFFDSLKKTFKVEEPQKEAPTLKNVNDYLPIGSVVLLKEGEKRLMICGIKQTAENVQFEEYDYIGVLYPEGHIDDEHIYLFNHNNIDKIFFRGYEDTERKEFIESLEEK